VATWATSLPQLFIQDSFQDTEPALFLRTEMDAGPPKLRRRFTAGHKIISGDMILTAAQKTTLRTFFQTYGATQNTFPDPDEGSDLTVVFMAEPTYTPYGGSYWKVSLQFAVLP
jgi:hypothetical protein